MIWFVGSYLVRFVDADCADKDAADARFIAWENTVLVKADTMTHAYEKIARIGTEEAAALTQDNQQANRSVVFEGVTELMKIDDDLGDGTEIMWYEHGSTKLKNLQKLVRPLADFEHE